MAHGQRHEAVNAFWRPYCDLPGNGCAPIVAEQVRTGDAKGIEDAENVGAEVVEVIGGGVSRGAGEAVAAQVGGEGPKSGVGQCSELMTPYLVAVGETMQEEDRG